MKQGKSVDYVITIPYSRISSHAVTQHAPAVGIVLDIYLISLSVWNVSAQDVSFIFFDEDSKEK